MNITLHEIPIREIFSGYTESEEGGVWAYSGRLNIRPPFQREFIYSDKQRDDVILSVRRDFPLNVMYWVMNDGGKFEMLDGQQRTISICRYLEDKFAVSYDGHPMMFGSLTDDEKEQILGYRLMIYFCDGTDSEKRDWFSIVNIAGEKLTDQELRNAIYPGSWLTDAKRRFSRNNGPAQNDGGKFLKGSPIRQDYLETVLKWYAESEDFDGKPDDAICACMLRHQRDSEAGGLWLYFQNVINWVKRVFTVYRKEMKGINWGHYYNVYGGGEFDAVHLEERIKSLMDDDDVTSVPGIYEYLLDGQEKHLSLRAFSDRIKRRVYEKQKGCCKFCGKHCDDIRQMEADHITPWSEGGHTTEDNCQLLCKPCNRKKGNK